MFKKHKLYYSFEKEEEYLNHMSQKGYKLEKYRFCTYYFSECQPGEYIYRLELLDEVPSNPKSREYIKFMEETGAEVVSTYIRWVYFRRKAADGPFELYSDADSKIKHYHRINYLWGIMGGLNFIIGIINLINSIIIEGALALQMSWINLLLGTFLLYLCWGNYKKIQKLNKEKLIHE